MSDTIMSLAELQRTMATAVMMPLTTGEEMRSHAPDGRAMSDVAASFIAPNSRLTAFERLEIYNRQYWFRVLGALAEDFAALRCVLGAQRFDVLLIAYLNAHPSRSFTLRNLGSKLFEWLRANPQYAGRRNGIAAAVARIEWAYVEAFDGAELTPLSLEQISALNSSSRLGLQPHLQLLALDYPADELVVALHQGEKRQASEAGVKQAADEPALVSLRGLRKRATWIAAHRMGFTVYYRRLTREQFHTLLALREGQPLAAALETGFARSAMSAARRARAVREWFAAWSELGWLCAFDS